MIRNVTLSWTRLGDNCDALMRLRLGLLSVLRAFSLYAFCVYWVYSVKVRFGVSSTGPVFGQSGVVRTIRLAPAAAGLHVRGAHVGGLVEVCGGEGFLTKGP